MEIKYVEEKSEPRLSHRFETDNWLVTIKDTDSKKLKKALEKLVDARKDWVNPLYKDMISRMTFVTTKLKKVDLASLKFEDTLIAITDKWKKVVDLCEQSKQKTIAEATAEIPFAKKAIKPLKKR